MIYRLTGLFLTVVVLGLGLCTEALAQDPTRLVRISQPIDLDGYPDEQVWNDVPALDLTMYEPISGGSMTERTEIRVAYDDDFLYVSGKMFDSDPEQIRGNTLYRDRYSGDDTFAIVLDTFNDNENALWFFTTPTGVGLITRYLLTRMEEEVGPSAVAQSIAPGIRSGMWLRRWMSEDGSPRCVFHFRVWPSRRPMVRWTWA